MALQHELGIACSRVPELDTTILGAGEDPVPVWGERDGEHEVLVALESLDAAAAFGAGVGVTTSGGDKLPHLDCLVQGA